MKREQRIMVVLRGIRHYLEKLDKVMDDLVVSGYENQELVKKYNLNCDIIHSLYYILPEDIKTQIKELPRKIWG